MSKGSAPRPYSVAADVFSENYCMTFGHKYKAGRCVNCGQSKERDAKDGDSEQSTKELRGNQSGE